MFQVGDLITCIKDTTQEPCPIQSEYTLKHGEQYEIMNVRTSIGCTCGHKDCHPIVLKDKGNTGWKSCRFQLQETINIPGLGQITLKPRK